jgi:hypothetical protein
MSRVDRLRASTATLAYMTQSNELTTLSIEIGTVRQWRAAGLTVSRFRSLVRAGALVRYRPGVYVREESLRRAAASPATAHALLVAAVTTAQSGRAAVASHQSAALIHGLDLLSAPPAGTVWLTRPPGGYRGQSVPGVRLHSARLPRDHVMERHGVWVTTATRTVVDLARISPFMAGVVSADSALRTGRTTDFGLARMLRSCARWPGIDNARRVVAFSDELAESALESCARVVFAEAGLPPPALQVPISDNHGQVIGRVDFYWPRHRTIAEADGMAKYGDPQRARDQIQRDIRLRDARYKVVHLTWAELFRTPARIVERVREAFSATTAH